jgi:DNA-binding NarL/FixJ family response regulator
VLSSRIDREWVQEAVSAGAAGFIDKFSDLAALRGAIDTVAHGGEYFSPKVSSVLTELLRLRSQPAEGPLLSYRECQVLREIARGRISKEMAESLGLSVFTIENLRRRIMRKTGLHSVAELTLHAMKLGLIGSPGAAESAAGEAARASSARRGAMPA